MKLFILILFVFSIGVMIGFLFINSIRSKDIYPYHDMVYSALREVKTVDGDEFIEMGLATGANEGNSKRTGIWVTFINDQLYGVIQFKDGTPHGQAMLFYPNKEGGGVNLSYYNNNGLADGEQYFFAESGELVNTVMLKNGEKVDD